MLVYQIEVLYTDNVGSQIYTLITENTTFVYEPQVLYTGLQCLVEIVDIIYYVLIVNLTTLEQLQLFEHLALHHCHCIVSVELTLGRLLQQILTTPAHIDTKPILTVLNSDQFFTAFFPKILQASSQNFLTSMPSYLLRKSSIFRLIWSAKTFVILYIKFSIMTDYLTHQWNTFV